MPIGVLATRNLLSNVTQPVYYNNSSLGVIVSVNICNRNATPITFSVAMCEEPAPEEHEWLECGTPIIAKGSFDRTQIFIAPGQYITAISSASNVSIQVWGMGFGDEVTPEESIASTTPDGSTKLNAAVSATAIKALTGTTTDGVYWIKASPASPAQQVYCIMDASWDGGGWMVAANNSAVDPVYQATHQPRLTSRIAYVGTSGSNSYTYTNNFSINVRDWAISEIAWCNRQPLGTFKDIYTYVYGKFTTPTYIPGSTCWARKFDLFHQTLPWLAFTDIRTRPSYTTDPTGSDTAAFSFITLNDGKAGYGDYSANYSYTPVTTLGRNAGNTSYVPVTNDSNAYGISGTFSWADRTTTTAATTNIYGWDDFQDGNSLGDGWGIAGSANYGRGNPSFIMVR